MSFGLTNNLIILIVLLTFYGYTNGQDLDEGDACKMKDNRDGVCTRLPECKSIELALRNRKITFRDLVHCSYIGNDEVICCPDRVPDKETSNPINVDNSDGIIFFDNDIKPKNIQTTTTTTTTTPTTSKPPSTTTSSSLSVERFVNLTNIKITDEEEYIDLTKLLRPKLTTTTSTISPKIQRGFSGMPVIDPATIFTTQKPWWLNIIPTEKRISNSRITTTEQSTINNFNNWIWGTTSSTTTQTSRNIDERPQINNSNNNNNVINFTPKSEKSVEQITWENHQKVFTTNSPTTTTATQNQFISNSFGWYSPTTEKSKIGVISQQPIVDGHSNKLNWSNEIIESTSSRPFICPTVPSTKSRSTTTTTTTRGTTTTTTTTSTTTTKPITSSTTSNINSNTNFNFNPDSLTNNTVLDPWMIQVLRMVSTTTQLPSGVGSDRLSPGNEVSSTKPNTVESEVRGSGKSEIACSRYSNGVRKGLTFHILSGVPTTLGEFPHMAALGYESTAAGVTYEWNCGGSLISETYVMTAAHCTEDERKPVIVRLGKITLVSSDDGVDPVDMNINAIINHPSYSSSKQYNDIALIRLDRSVELNDYVRPACLYTEMADVDASLPFVVTGWGSTSTRTRQKSSVLLKANLTAVSLSQCNQSFVDYGTSRRYDQGIIQGQLCAIDYGGEKDACEGDSGGPIQLVDKNGVSTVVGVTSFGISCATSIPGVYSRVAFYLDWIESIVW